MVTVSNRARSRRRVRQQRPTALLLLLLLAVVLATGPLLGQAFQLPWGAGGRKGAAGRLQTRDPVSTGTTLQQEQRVSPVVMFAKPKKGPKGLDAAKAAGGNQGGCIMCHTRWWLNH